jgi:hypothetical protein
MRSRASRSGSRPKRARGRAFLKSTPRSVRAVRGRMRWMRGLGHVLYVVIGNFLHRGSRDRDYPWGVAYLAATSLVSAP